MSVRRIERAWAAAALVALGACGSSPARPVVEVTTTAEPTTQATTTTVLPTMTTVPVTTTTTRPAPATTAVTSFLSNPATLSNPDPNVGGLACTLRYWDRPQGAHCYWNGLTWVPSN